MRFVSAAAAILISGVGALGADAPEATVPFVGCESYGQAQMLPAPKGEAQSVPIAPKDAAALAWYASADGIGVLGPRGWYCEGDSGSSGFGLFLAPRQADLANRIRKHFEGAAIAIYHITSEASGMWEVAEFEGRLFPAYRPAARRLYEKMGMRFPDGPFPRDVLTYSSKTIVEYTTPGACRGSGNKGLFVDEAERHANIGGCHSPHSRA